MTRHPWFWCFLGAFAFWAVDGLHYTVFPAAPMQILWLFNGLNCFRLALACTVSGRQQKGSK